MPLIPRLDCPTRRAGAAGDTHAGDSHLLVADEDLEWLDCGGPDDREAVGRDDVDRAVVDADSGGQERQSDDLADRTRVAARRGNRPVRVDLRSTWPAVCQNEVVGSVTSKAIPRRLGGGAELGWGPWTVIAGTALAMLVARTVIPWPFNWGASSEPRPNR